MTSGYSTLVSRLNNSDHIYDLISFDETDVKEICGKCPATIQRNTNKKDPHYGTDNKSSCPVKHTVPSLQDTHEKESSSSSVYLSIKDLPSSSKSANSKYPVIPGESHALPGVRDLIRDDEQDHNNNTTCKKCFVNDLSPGQAETNQTSVQENVSSNQILPEGDGEDTDKDHGTGTRNSMNYSKSYLDLIRRCDQLINTMQRQNQETMSLIATCKRFRMTVYVQTVMNVTLVIVSLLLITAYGLSRNESSMVHGVLLQNLTRRIRDIEDDNVVVKTMVNDIMTRSRSVIRLTSGHQAQENADRHTVKWVGRDNFVSGSLKLSENGQEVAITDGAFYDIYCKIHFMANVNETKEITLAFEIVHRRETQEVHVEHAFQRQTTLQGRIRQDVAVETTRYLVSGDVIAVRVTADQWSQVAKYQGASTLILYELT